MGGVGAFLGMIVFHHKTKHKKFTIGLPLCMISNFIIHYYYLSIIAK